MARSFYTVSFRNVNGNSSVSRFFKTKVAALRWAKFLRTLGDIAETSVYLGEAGGSLVERRGA